MSPDNKETYLNLSQNQFYISYNSIALLTVATFLLAIGLYSAIGTHSPVLKDFAKAG